MIIYDKIDEMTSDVLFDGLGLHGIVLEYRIVHTAHHHLRLVYCGAC